LRTGGYRLRRLLREERTNRQENGNQAQTVSTIIGHHLFVSQMDENPLLLKEGKAARSADGVVD
jgi:hypothetical protein